ncbi:Zinc finger C3H1 domain-containing protein [Bienertia sinuspersici]
MSSGTINGGLADIPSQMPYRKSLSVNRVSSKSSNPEWRAPGANGNLVISFSDDDDSGSDAEEQREKASACNRPPLVLNSNKRPPTLPHVKMQNVSKTSKKEGKVTRKVSSSRKPNSSVTKIHESSMRSGVPALAEQRVWWKDSNATGRSLGSQDPGSSKNLDMSSSKLEDLRQQIAAREHELKLKLMQQNKENVSETSRDTNTVGQRKVSSRKCKSLPADLPPPKEPDRKRLRTNASGVNFSCSLSDWISKPKQAALSPGPLERSSNVLFWNKSEFLSLSSSGSNFLFEMSKNPGVVSKNQPSRSAPNQDIHESNMNKVNVHCDATSALKKFKSMSDNSLQACTLPLSTSRFESPDVSLDDTSLFLHLGKSGDFRSGEVDVQSLFELEELHDKELEEAQEHRRKCEVEERNALSAYRRAQRALLQANTRCTYLYRKRELYSTQLRSFLLEDPSPSLEEFEAGNQIGYDSNVQSADADAHNRSSANVDGHNLGSEACSEPDASTSELVRGNRFAADGMHSPSIDPNLSPDDDYETFPLDHGTPHASMRHPICNDNIKESVKDVDAHSPTNLSTVGSQDPLFLEEYLRSKLISRLGASSTKHSAIGDNSKSPVERAGEEGVAGAKSQMIMQCVSHSDHNVSAADCRDDSKHCSLSKPLLNTQNQLAEDHCLSGSPLSYIPEEHRFPSVEIASISTSSSRSTSILRSAMKALSSVTLVNMLIKEQPDDSLDICAKNNMPFRPNQDKSCLEMISSAEQLVTCASFGKVDSYTCKSVIDPSWPLCMYELRGRCNNDECPWQHAKDYIDCQSNCQSLMCPKEFVVLTPPKYLVCLNSLEGESHTYASLKARYFGSLGKNIFGCSLALSSSIIKHLPSNEPCLHGNDGCVEFDGDSGHSLYFQSRNSAVNPLRNGLADSDQSLEVALIILSQEADKIEGSKKALSVLSRALEADPSSLPIWVIYLVLYYSTKYSTGELNKKSLVEKDDFFSYSSSALDALKCDEQGCVKHIEGSYELWLLYINSRGHLNERFSAYERALSRMCQHTSVDDGQWVHRSAAILDLFLQMLYCFCVSGNFVKALQRIHRLVYADGDSDESHSLLLSDILQCLTISDKCIFWVCCVYLVIYRKLPDSLVQQFEFEKDASLIEWPSVHLTVEEKQHVSKLMEMAVDSVGLHVKIESLEGSALKSVHLLAVNHVMLMAAVDGVESCKVLLEKYRKSFSSCLNLVLLSARAEVSVDECTKFQEFEATVSNWPKDVSGVQCIWNQFAEYAVEKGKLDRGKEIMNQWFHSAGVPPVFHKRTIGEIVDSKGILADLQLGSNLSTHTLNYNNNTDLVFGLLNLSLYRLFQNDVLEAHIAIDKALKIADAEALQHCVKEHAAFMFHNGSQLMKDVSVVDIRKPRTRQLVRNILSPVSPDSLLVNSVLDVWFGSSLLPPKFDQLKDMVDFVENVLELSPANYRLVISVCKFVYRDSDSSNSKSISVLFWASSLLVNTIYHAIPVPPENVWVEAAEILGKLTNVQEICESFHHRALSVYPFSINLWKSFLNQCTEATKRSSVVKAAREKGLELD